MVASAATTLGISLLDAERHQIHQLATRLCDLRPHRHEAEHELAAHATTDPALAPIAAVVGKTTAAVLYATLGDLGAYTSVRALYRAPGSICENTAAVRSRAARPLPSAVAPSPAGGSFSLPSAGSKRTRLPVGCLSHARERQAHGVRGFLDRPTGRSPVSIRHPYV